MLVCHQYFLNTQFHGLLDAIELFNAIVSDIFLFFNLLFIKQNFPSSVAVIDSANTIRAPFSEYYLMTLSKGISMSMCVY